MPEARPTIIDIHQDEVLTGEAVALDVQPIGYFLRALGVLIDMLIGVALIFLLVLLMGWLDGMGLLPADVMPILTIVVIVLVTVAIPTVVETTSHGRSLGKLAVGGRIVRSDGGAAGFRHALIRALVGVFELWFTLGAVAALVGAFTPRSQRLGDLMAGTYSERTRTPRLAPTSFEIPPPLAGWAEIADVARLPERPGACVCRGLPSPHGPRVARSSSSTSSSDIFRTRGMSSADFAQTRCISLRAHCPRSMSSGTRLRSRL